MHARMWNRETRLVYAQTVVEQNVQIQRARRVSEFPYASVPALYVEHSIEQCVRREDGVDLCNGINEIRLVQVTDRSRAV